MAIKFDQTINLGHLLSFAGFVISAMVFWATMDKRVAVLEEARTVQTSIDRRQDEAFSEMKRMQREDMREINNKLDRLIGMQRPSLIQQR